MTNLRVLITGGANGLGRAIAGRLAASGGTVAIADIDSSDARAAADELGPSAIAVGMDPCSLVVRLRFDLVERVTATLDLGDDVVCGGFPDERFGVTVPMLGPGDDRVA